MAGRAALRAEQERHLRSSRGGQPGFSSSVSDLSSSGPTRSAPPSEAGSYTSRRSRAMHNMDGNRDPEQPGSAGERDPSSKSASILVNPRNFDLSTTGWSTVRRSDVPRTLPSRPAPSKLGTAAKTSLNSFQVEALPTEPIYQFEVLIGSGVEKRGLVRRMWESNAVRTAVGRNVVYDGDRLAWSKEPIKGAVNMMVDLDSEYDRKVKPGNERKNIHRILIRQTNRVRMDVLAAYLNKQVSFDNACLEAINFLDHALREWPSKNFTQIKRSFYPKSQTPFALSGGVIATKGVYSSMRIVHGGQGQPARLAVNVDVANGTFWTGSPLKNLAMEITGITQVADLMLRCKAGEKGAVGIQLKKLRKLHVQARHRVDHGSKDAFVENFVVEKLIYQSAKDFTFAKDGKQISLYQYFQHQHGIALNYPGLPLVQTTKKLRDGSKVILPMELLQADSQQRYPFKLDERQTSNMIKFAVTPPKERFEAIQNGLKMLNWPQDPVLRHFGIKVSINRTTVDSRVIAAPIVQFGQGDAKPGTSGRWDLKGKKFLTPNPLPLKSWGVCVVPGRRGGKPDKSVVTGFIKEFIKGYINHGGKVENKDPSFTLASGDDIGTWVTVAWNTAGQQSQIRPQMLVFILPDKQAEVYGRIKRSADCRYGVVSQCMQYAHVQKCQAQYISNVCMKFNAKLGGTTARAIGAKSKGPSGIFTTATCIIGADVSHGSPGSDVPSMAAMTMSMDKLGIRYAAGAETNGHRVEMIQEENINSILKPLLKSWMQNVNAGKLPSRIMYFRDGVSEGQYQHVLQQEVRDIKELLKGANPGMNIPMVVLVGSKRHHVRFFPPAGGDRNGNALPGTLVEAGVTHPFENDFYLASHAAIKGTARPMHYHVLLNEADMPNEEIQTLIYEHCYQYIRATTPVSQHPAIYYAHLASNRAVPHDPKWAGSSDGPPPVAAKPRSGSQSGSQPAASGGVKSGSQSGPPPEVPKLLPMPNAGNIMTSMWYI
ncbi:hypothetical protein B0A50_08176 [Salinomyces thailandicus]|uniref:Uncharacterized protein n=1 Tax=Salinomyces thailandicus TaxID=706561 RepID=A0A4U0TKN5_9PEZI|nr:hypothetical protein B0A50_08176 [Salinomyces thailandica]